MSAHDPSSSLTTYLLAALNELQLVQQNTQRELDAEKASSRQLQEKLNTSHETIAQLREELRAKQIAADERSALPPAQKSKHAATQRSPSPDHLNATALSKPKKKKRRKNKMQNPITIRLLSLRMKAGSWQELNLIHSWEHKAIQFSKDDVVLEFQGSDIQLISDHAQTVFCSTKSSAAVVLVGSADIVSSGRIWLELTTTGNLDMFLEAVNHMNDRAIIRNLDEIEFTDVCKAGEIFFGPAARTIHHELQAMRHRQNRGQILAVDIEAPSFSQSACRGDSLKRKHTDEAIQLDSNNTAAAAAAAADDNDDDDDDDAVESARNKEEIRKLRWQLHCMQQAVGRQIKKSQQHLGSH